MKSIDIGNTSEKAAKILFSTGCIIFRPRQPFKLVSGMFSPIYVDNRRLISFPTARKQIAKYLAKKVEKLKGIDIIAGAATGGIPHSAWVSELLKLPMVYVRGKPKDHGQGNQIEGLLRRGQHAVVIEDMVSTGGSSEEVIRALRKAGAIVRHEVAIYTHSLKKSDQNFNKLKVQFYPLTSLTDVTKVAQKAGFIKGSDVKLVKIWAQDPKNWGRKMGFE